MRCHVCLVGSKDGGIFCQCEIFGVFLARRGSGSTHLCLFDVYGGTGGDEAWSVIFLCELGMRCGCAGADMVGKCKMSVGYNFQRGWICDKSGRRLGGHCHCVKFLNGGGWLTYPNCNNLE